MGFFKTKNENDPSLFRSRVDPRRSLCTSCVVETQISSNRQTIVKLWHIICLFQRKALMSSPGFVLKSGPPIGAHLTKIPSLSSWSWCSSWMQMILLLTDKELCVTTCNPCLRIKNTKGFTRKNLFPNVFLLHFLLHIHYRRRSRSRSR